MSVADLVCVWLPLPLRVKVRCFFACEHVDVYGTGGRAWGAAAGNGDTAVSVIGPKHVLAALIDRHVAACLAASACCADWRQVAW